MEKVRSGAGVSKGLSWPVKCVAWGRIDESTRITCNASNRIIKSIADCDSDSDCDCEAAAVCLIVCGHSRSRSTLGYPRPSGLRNLVVSCNYRVLMKFRAASLKSIKRKIKKMRKYLTDTFCGHLITRHTVHSL